MRFELGLAGDQQISRTIARTVDRVQDARPAFHAIADELRQNNVRNFQAQGAYAGQRWKPLSPVYREWKQKNYPGRPILVRTGRLRRSLTGKPFGVERIGSLEMEIGTDVPYARFHQQGTRNMPRRRPLELSAAARTQMTKILQQYLTTGET